MTNHPLPPSPSTPTPTPDVEHARRLLTNYADAEAECADSWRRIGNSDETSAAEERESVCRTIAATLPSLFAAKAATGSSVYDLAHIEDSLKRTGIAGIFDGFADPADAITQMAQHIKDLELRLADDEREPTMQVLWEPAPDAASPLATPASAATIYGNTDGSVSVYGPLKGHPGEFSEHSTHLLLPIAPVLPSGRNSHPDGIREPSLPARASQAGSVTPPATDDEIHIECACGHDIDAHQHGDPNGSSGCYRVTGGRLCTCPHSPTTLLIARLSDVQTKLERLEARSSDETARDAERLLRFAGLAWIGSHAADGYPGDWGGADVQDALEECGITAPHAMTRPCDPGPGCVCVCIDFGFPTSCFRLTALGERARDAARSPSPVAPETNP